MRKASPASCKTMMAILWNCESSWIIWAIPLTTLWNGNFLISVSVLDWYFLLPLGLLAPSLHLHSFLFPTALSPLLSSFSTFLLTYLMLTLLLLFFCSLGIGHFYFSCAVSLVLCTISNNKNKFYMLHPSIYIPILILFLSNDSLVNISGRHKPMHAIENKTKQNNSSNTCCWTKWLVIPWSHLSDEGSCFWFGDFSMGPFSFSLPFSTNP